MANSFVTRHYHSLVPETPKEAIKAHEMPVASARMGGLHPGAPDAKPQPGRRGPKDLPWQSWLKSKRPGIKRKRKRGRGFDGLTKEN
jgi:hypothetical protein